MTIIIEHPNLNKYKKRECNHKWKVFMANDFVAMKCEICGNVPSKTETIDNLLGYIKEYIAYYYETDVIDKVLVETNLGRKLLEILDVLSDIEEESEVEE